MQFRPGLAATVLSGMLVSVSTPALAQLAPDQTAAGTNRPLKLAPDSPFRDPDIIYLEADELINDEAENVLTAIGEVEGRYQDRTLRANRVDYNLETGQVLASGDVVLIDATGDVQYADKLELSDELQAGTAANFTARLATGATTAARFVTRSEEGEFELFNVTYTACEICENSEGEKDRPTWRLRARRVKQDEASRTIRYNDAVLELFGIPVFYTPYLAHPDPSQDRASGLLIPTIGLSGARGASVVLPYFWAMDDYTDVTITPRIFSKVNPLLEIEGKRKFATGELNLSTSFTYSTLFGRNGDSLDDPTRPPTSNPTSEPTSSPTQVPTSQPTNKPTSQPTDEPTGEPTQEPTREPNDEPTTAPTIEPTKLPTAEPTVAPTGEPTSEPTDPPTKEPTLEPTSAPSSNPTDQIACCSLNFKDCTSGCGNTPSECNACPGDTYRWLPQGPRDDCDARGDECSRGGKS